MTPNLTLYINFPSKGFVTAVFNRKWHVLLYKLVFGCLAGSMNRRVLFAASAAHPAAPVMVITRVPSGPVVCNGQFPPRPSRDQVPSGPGGNGPYNRAVQYCSQSSAAVHSAVQ